MTERLKSEKEVATCFSHLNVILMGAPGSGKSTLIEKMSEHAYINYVYLGGITRRELDGDTDLSKELRRLFETSEPWPDEFVLSIVAPHLLDAKDTGFVLDGIPKKESEAIALKEWSLENEVNFDLVVVLDVAEEVAIERMDGRSSHNRLERQSHYQTRFAKWREGRSLIIDILGENAKVLEVNTNDVDEDGVFAEVLSYSAMNFMGS